MLGGLFAHEGDEIDGDREIGEDAFVFPQGFEHGCHGAFRIRCAAAPDFTIADLAGKRGYSHVFDADCIEVWTEEDARATVERGEASDEVGAARLDFLKRDLGSGVGEPVCEEIGHRLLVGDIRLVEGGVVGIDGGDADEILEEHAGNSKF